MAEAAIRSQIRNSTAEVAVIGTNPPGKSVEPVAEDYKP